MNKLDHFVVMGVAGCGKSTIARLLADRHNTTIIEADDFHAPESVAKMRSGEAISDDERWPWLNRIGIAMQSSPKPVFASCSALRRAHRKCLLDSSQVSIGFIHLHTRKELIARRMQNRKGHFMPTSLLDSQFEILEMLSSNERGVVVDIEQPVSTVVEEAMRFVNTCRV